MRDQLFKTFMDIKWGQCYSRQYYRHLSKSSIAASVVTCLAAAALTKVLSEQLAPAIVVALLLVAVDVYLAIKPYFPWEKRLPAMKFFISDLTKLTDAAELNWGLHQSDPDPIIASIIEDLRSELTIMEERYFDGESFPQKKRLKKRAIIDFNTYMDNHDY